MDIQSRGKWIIQFKKVRAKSQSLKSKGKIIIALRNMDKNTIVPL